MCFWCWGTCGRFHCEQRLLRLERNRSHFFQQSCSVQGSNIFSLHGVFCLGSACNSNSLIHRQFVLSSEGALAAWQGDVRMIELVLWRYWGLNGIGGRMEAFISQQLGTCPSPRQFVRQKTYPVIVTLNSTLLRPRSEGDYVLNVCLYHRVTESSILDNASLNETRGVEQS